MSATPPAEPQAGPHDPWDRWGWLYAAMWLVFLGFPVAAALTADRPTWVRAGAVVLIAVFAVVYLWGFVPRLPRRLARTRLSDPTALGVLASLWAVTTWAVGIPTLGMLIFVVSYAAFLAGRRVLVVTVGAVLATTVVAAVASAGDGTWFLVPLVVVSTGAIVGLRLLEDRQEDRRDLLEQIALVAERDRVARDVHDVLGHTLTVVTTKAELAERVLERDPARATAELQEIRALSREALAEIRATVAGLRVARLDEELAAARVALTAAGIEVEVQGDVATVDPRHRLVLAWVLREAVTNVVRHSRAERCDVVLAAHALSVVDDGCGLSGTTPGQGLGGLAERARSAGATLDLEATGLGRFGCGTRLRVGWS